MIQSFGDRETCDLFVDGDVPAKGCGWADVSDVAERKLEMVNSAEQVEDLREPPAIGWRHSKAATIGTASGSIISGASGFDGPTMTTVRSSFTSQTPTTERAA